MVFVQGPMLEEKFGMGKSGARVKIQKQLKPFKQKNKAIGPKQTILKKKIGSREGHLPCQDACSRIPRSHLVRHIHFKMLTAIVDKNMMVVGRDPLQIFQHKEW